MNTSELRTVTQILSIVGAGLMSGGMTFWLFLLITSNRNTPRPNFVSEIIVFVSGTLLAIVISVLTLAPFQWRTMVSFVIAMLLLFTGVALWIHIAVVTVGKEK